jgi:hypothetical protein
VSPSHIRFCQKMCTRAAPAFPFVRDPARNANGTNPIASQNRFASMSCAHQQQYNRHPYALRSNCPCNKKPPRATAAPRGPR